MDLSRAQKLSFVEMFGAAARESMKRFGVPASVTVAQAILESRWGQSELAIQCKNFFGIKARKHMLAGEEYQEFPSPEYENGKLKLVVSKFQKFKSVPECFVRHGELLSSSDRYQPAMAVAQDAARFALQLLGCGYSTDPQYAKKLGDLIRQYDLTRFDVPTEPPAKAKEVAA